MKEVYDLLKDAVAFTPEETDEIFKITEENGEWVLKAFRYLDGPTFGKILRAVSSKGGSYRKDETTKFAIFTLPKTPSPQATNSQTDYKEVGNAVQIVSISALSPMTFRARVKPEFELEDLVESIRTYGVLEPILVRRKGELYEIVAGERRVKAAKTAGLTEVPVIVKSLSDVDAFVIQLSENLQRKDLSEEEKSMALAELAKKTGWKAQQIADKIKKSYSFVIKYLPADFKDQEKARAGALGGESKSLTVQHAATQRVAKPQDSTVTTPTQPQEVITPPTDVYKTYMHALRECEKCGGKEERDKMSFINNQLVCRKCAGKDKPLTVRKLEEESTFKPKEKPEFRRAVMQPQKSKFELAVIQELQAEGLPLETDVEICAVKTIPDAILRLQTGNIAIYIDNEVTHPEGNGRDEFLRDKIEVQGWKVLPVRWKNDSQEERQRAKETIREYLKW